MYKDFTEMPVWQLAMEVAEHVFIITNDLPKKEDYGLTSQIRRASVSVSANIAEAFGRSTAPDKSKFYDYSRGSAFETKSLLMYGKNVGYFESESTQQIIEKLSKIIYDLNKVKLALANKVVYQPIAQPLPLSMPLPQPQPLSQPFPQPLLQPLLQPLSKPLPLPLPLPQPLTQPMS